MSYLFVGAFTYHLMRVRVVTDELEKIEAELSEEAAERRRRSVPKEDLVNEIVEEVEVLETPEEEEEEEEEEPLRKEENYHGVFVDNQNMILKRWNRTPGVARD
jgi:AMMECR1 domain-containing protein